MSVASKNPFDLLGNDDGDSDAPAAPVKTVEKTSTHTAKRNTDGLAPASKAPASSGNRRGGYSGNEAAFRDRAAGSERNRARGVDDAPRGGRARGGGRGGRFTRERGDRAPGKHIPHGGSEKTAGQTWGATEGQAELKDEQAGEAIAESEKKEAVEGEAAEEAKEPKEEVEPEEKVVSFAEYQRQQAEKRAALEAEAALQVRKPNEGTKENKKWASAKALSKDEDDDFIAGTSGKAKRERERKVKQLVEIDNRYIEPERPRGGRGGRGGSRGDFRGDFRGSGRGDAGRGRARGGPRGEFRGGRGGRSEPTALNTSDEAAFPSLGGK